MTRSRERWDELGNGRGVHEGREGRVLLSDEPVVSSEQSFSSTVEELAPWLWGAALAGAGAIAFAALRTRRNRGVKWPLVVRVSLEPPREPRGMFAFAGAALARVIVDHMLVAARTMALDAAERAAGAVTDAPVVPHPSPVERSRSTENGHPRI